MTDLRDATFWLAAAMTLLLLAPLAYAQVSPGPLSKVHAHLDGNANCTKCHSRGDGGMDAKCLQCHREITALRAQKRGFHGRKPGACASCHPDHAGRDFAMIEWPGGTRDTFDHALTGWPLDGKHKTVACTDCHKAKFEVADIATMHPTPDKKQHWTGLEARCASCHEDVHHGQLGTECTKCHSLEAFKPAPRFDHTNTSFPLRGKHQPLDCKKCHEAQRLTLQTDSKGHAIPLYKPLPHEQCSSCHQDPHKGRLGPKCTDCHTEASFHSVNLDGKPFDHSRTKYPLQGKHTSVACAACHKGGIAQTPRPAFATCTACHIDAHAGQATLAGKPADCAACHTVDSFEQTTFTLARHQQSGYPLQGKHAAVKCALCHVKNPKGVDPVKLGKAGVLIRAAHDRCTACHRDQHGGQLAKRAEFADCASCHRVEGFKPSTFDVARHAKARLPLNGKHASLECAACHSVARKSLAALPAKEVLGNAGVQFALNELKCEQCHRDAHGGRFAKASATGPARGCADCHAEKSFRPSTYDAEAHKRCNFPLDGAHRAIPCSQCHTDLQRAPAKATLLLASVTEAPLTMTMQKSKCTDCHESPHGVQFVGRPGGDNCSVCHDAKAFKPAGRFDHDRNAKFKLEGAHEKVACAKCHTTRPENGKSVVIYRPVLARCEDCHRRPPQGRQP